MKTILACFAHPDDEAFGVAGILTHYARQGVRVDALGLRFDKKVGEISDPGLSTVETLAQVREDEMRCAAQIIGADELIFLNYRDSGMAGTAANERPDAFTNAPAREVVPTLVAIMRRVPSATRSVDAPMVVLNTRPFLPPADGRSLSGVLCVS